MTVYVDNMQAKYGRMIMCHMIADTVEELKQMARNIGVAEKWHQGDHFDICLAIRAKAVQLGAVEITWRQTGAMLRRQKVTGRMGKPEDCEAWFKDYLRSTKS